MVVIGCGSATISPGVGSGGTGGLAGQSAGGAGGRAGAVGTGGVSVGGAAGSGVAVGGTGGGTAGNGGGGGSAGHAGGTGGLAAGGAAGTTTGGAAGTAAGGAAGMGTGTAGSGGSPGGAGGTGICSSTTSDALNCGKCGHSCLGGDCVGGLCQPLLLGTIPDPTQGPGGTRVSGGKTYVFTSDGPAANPNAWQFDANAPSTPIEFKTNGGTASCVMNGQLFWVQYQPSITINACTFANCTATKTPIVTLDATESLDAFPGCDAVNNEIVWVTKLTTSADRVIHRASAMGANARTITAVTWVEDGTTWSYAGLDLNSSQTERLFFIHSSSDGTGMSTLYYVSTKAVNATPVSVASIPNGGLSGTIDGVLSNSATVLINAFVQPSTVTVFSAPLPNGIVSGTPPTFITGGNISSGIVDDTDFYGTLSLAPIPSDAMVKCPLTNCSSPAIMARGQAGADHFSQDATAIYWTTSGQATALWKLAK